jgi:hypothetical protein
LIPPGAAPDARATFRRRGWATSTRNEISETCGADFPHWRLAAEICGMTDAPLGTPPRPSEASAPVPPFTLDRVPFLAAGLGLFAVKYAIDHSVARFGFGRGWSPWDYLVTSLPITALS